MMTYNEDKLKVDKQKEIINNIISELATETADLYYSSSRELATLVHEKIQTVSLTHEKYELVKSLSIDDIVIYMSYHSKCC